MVATQKPTVDVITGLIKSNLPARICFQVSSRVDSRVVLDEMGADKLLGKGDMLFLQPGTSTLLRVRKAPMPATRKFTRSCSTWNASRASPELVQLKTRAEKAGRLLETMRERDEAVRSRRGDCGARGPRQRVAACSARWASATAGRPG